MARPFQICLQWACYCCMVCKQTYGLTDTEPKTYSAGAWLEILVVMCSAFPLFHTERSEKNILNVLHEARFADGHWAQLGLQLIDHFDSATIGANHQYQASLCMIDTISQWLRTDTEASWEKLAAAVAEVKGYGKATADTIRREAGIGKLRTDF